MLSLLRRLTKSRIGVIVTLIVLVIIALAFALADVNTTNISGGGPSGNTVATIGKTSISDTALQSRLQVAVQNARQQQPDLNMTQFVQQGGMDQTLTDMIQRDALDQFAHKSGMVVSKQVIDGQIADLPVFQGLDGKFSQEKFNQVLAAQNLTVAQLRDEVRRSTLAQRLIGPTLLASHFPKSLALPYASLMLEKRHGTIGFIPTATMKQPAKPDDKQLAAYYKKNIAKYTIPERRVIRYAMITPAQVADAAKPSQAEIAQAYKAAGSKYQAHQKRSAEMVIVSDKGTAQKIAAAVKGGQSVKAAASAAGLDATTLDSLNQQDMTDQSNADFAKAVFAAKKGDAVGPVQATLGWYIGRVTAVTDVPGKTLAEATPEIAKDLTQQKEQTLLGDMQDKLDDGITNGSTFAQLVQDNKLDGKQTPAVLPSGVDLEHPEQKPDPALQPVIQAGFQFQQGDQPQFVQLGQDGSFALVALGKIVPAAPRPLTAIHDQVEQDYLADKANEEAHAIATKVVNAVNKGTPLIKAIADTGVRTERPQNIDLSRQQLTQMGNRIPPPLALLFSMTEKKAKLLAAPNNAGWAIVYLDKIDRGDASKDPDMVQKTQKGLSSVLGSEYAEEFTNAVSDEVGVKRNAAAIASLKAQLTGTAAPAQ
ncbi:hypothetical protein GCM10023219_05860 [Stakelama sediminis]|uniref:Parvulin-like PPIase n=1 Tax=Stakelama sediminis TaxID=463200 RepID=A0A840YUJ8_9SPHN|nr:peptidylprolyl isomerase [Stakelama sediminis]MBB5717303.1 peptidyl-prolyl cis-trans isomerase D [Stakelama sediminis]